MRRYIRARVDGATYFFTLVTYKWRRFLTSELAEQCLRHAWHKVRARRPFQVQAVCVLPNHLHVLPNHLHCLWTLPEGDTDFSIRWAAIKALFSKAYLEAGGCEGRRNESRKRRGEAALWQRRFWEHVVRDEDDFIKHLEYIHYNPVKHGYVSRPADWRWSSFSRYVSLGLHDPLWGQTEPDAIADMNVPELPPDPPEDGE